jgi:hypothetical protein
MEVRQSSSRVLESMKLTSNRIHVFADLEAYICTFQDCQYSLATFPSRELWAAHEFSAHRKAKVWACSECDSEFLTAQDLVQHLQTQYGLVYSKVDLEVALLAAEKVQDRQCPLCLKTTNGKRKDFAAHVGKHMEAIALTTLPKESESDVEHSSQSGLDEESDGETSIPPAVDPLESPLVLYDEDDGNNRTYCLCNDVGYGDMVACDNEYCEKEWFHWSCVGIKREPIGNWYCPDCKNAHGVDKQQQPHFVTASQSSLASGNAEIQNNSQKQETRCSLCSHAPFKDSSSLRIHIAAAHTRPFSCVFFFAGCTSTFRSKNEWKRHIASEHLCLTYYRCSSCPQSTAEGSTAKYKSNEFKRKDLFTQHIRRMHAPFAVKKAIAKGDSKLQHEWETHVNEMQAECLVIRRQPPQRSACPKLDCSNIFEGAGSWDDWMEHVGRHMEKGEAGRLGVDRLLARWALEEGIVERRDNGEYRLTGSETEG